MMFHATADAKAQGALVTWAHWPYPSMEAPLDIALGRIDSVDILTTGSPFEHHPILVDIYKMYGPKGVGALYVRSKGPRVRLTPIIQDVANERGLHLLFSVVDSGLVWADPALDITTEVIQKFDAAGGGAAPKPAAAAPAPKPAAPAAAPKPATPAPKPAN